MGTQKCPNKSPSCCHTYVIYVLCPHKSINMRVYTHTHTHTHHTHTHTQHTHTRARTHAHINLPFILLL